MYEPLLRADFTIFDEYVHQPLPPVPEQSAAAGAARPDAKSQPGALQMLREQQPEQHQSQQQHGNMDATSASAPFAFPITAFYGTEDRCVHVIRISTTS